MWWSLAGVAERAGRTLGWPEGSHVCWQQRLLAEHPPVQQGMGCENRSCSSQMNNVFKHIPGCHKLQQTKFR